MILSMLFSLEALIFDSSALDLSSLSFSSAPAMTYRRLDSISCHRRSWIALIANKHLKMVARIMRKIHVPAYCPVLEGAQEVE